MKGCFLFPAALVSGFVFGLATKVVARAITGDDDLSSAIGVGFGFLSMLLVTVYGSLWLSSPNDFVSQDARAESKLQTAEIRIGFIFALIGGATATSANGSTVAIVFVTTCCAALGGLIGFDLKRRVRRMREQLPDDEHDGESWLI